MKFEITAWDCYNWHNLKEQHHRLRPGDMLCIGPSESGKTTILDAIQQVLTGDVDVQLNSAADPVRGKTELKEKGRNLRTIVLRIEEEGTFLGSVGFNIAYFIVELTDPHTKETFVLALGAKAHSEGKTVDKWWAIGRGMSIDDVVFTREADGKKYALDKDALRAQNPKCAVYETARYRLELVDVLFPSLREQPDAEKRAHLQKWATYLNIAKSYGRMHSVEPNALIRDALPEPRIEAFEVAKRAIGEINEIRLRVSEAEQRLLWMTEAQNHLKHARERQVRLHANEYARLKLVHDGVKTQIARLKTQKETQQSLASQKQTEAQKLRDQLTLAEARVRALDNPEARALMDEIRRCKDEIDEITSSLGPLQEKLVQARKKAEELQAKIKSSEGAFLDARNGAFGAIVAHGKVLKGTLREAVDGLADAVRSGIREDIGSASMKAEAEQLKSVRNLVQQEEAQRALATAEGQKLTQLRLNERRLVGMQDLAPLPAAADRVGELGQRARLLYQGIEVLHGREKDAVLLQEFLGARVLSAILPANPEGFDHVKRHVHATNPELLVVETSQLQEFGLLTGILQCIDVEKSDAAAVRYLANIARDVALLDKGTARDSHERIVWRDGTVYDGKTWHIEPATDLKYIGERARKDARERELNQIREAISAAEKAAQGYTNKAIQFERDRITVENALKNIVTVIQKANFEQYRSDLRVWNSELESQTDRVSGLATEVESLKTRREVATEAHVQLLKDAEKSGAKAAVEQQAAAEAAVGSIRLELEEVGKAAATAAGRAEDAQNAINERVGDLQTAERDLDTARDVLVGFAGMTTREVEEYLDHEGITKLNETGLRNSNNAVMGLLEKHRAEVRKYRDELVRHSEDIEFVETQFIVRETRSGRLLDERIRILAEETAADRRKQIERVRDIQHQQVIEPIGEMLKEDLENLEKTIHDINDHLKRTPFNGRRYTLTKELKPDAPKLLVKLIADYTRTNTEPLKDELLRLFSEEERTPQQLQQYFDYRMWFAFELQRSRPLKGEEFATAASAGGSGGAQAAPHYILSYAMLTMFYRTTNARTWIILLDEAFTRVDPANRFVLYEMAKDLGFSVIAANTEFDGHSTLRKTANILFVKKDLKTFETHVKPWSQEFHESGQTRL